MLSSLLEFNDIANILIRFILNLLVITILIRGVYYNYRKDTEYVFTFFLFNVLIFFICFLMMKIEISMAFGLGLFAIFGILRYRTDTIPIKEMTYLFTAIALALINAVAPLTGEVLFMNVAIVLFIYIMEKLWFSNKEQYKIFTYEKIDLIRDGKKDQILSDLKSRSQLNITRYEIKNMNFLNDSADLKVYFTPDV